MSFYGARWRALSIAILLLGACTNAAPRADVAPPVSLARWASQVDTLAGTYTSVTSVAEFWDSVVVVTDLMEREAWRIEINTGTRALLGTKGNGPGEYQSLATAVKIHRDSVALLYLRSPRFPVLSVGTGRGRTHELWRAGGGTPTGSLSIGAAIWRYADTLGHLYGAPSVSTPTVDWKTGRRETSSIRMLESIPVVRYTFATGRLDTLLHIPRGVAAARTERDASGARLRSMELGPYGAFNGWLVTEGGQLIVADAARYALQMRDAVGNGAVMADWQIPSNALTVSAGDWNTYVEKTTKGSIAEIAKLNARVMGKVGEPSPATSSIRYEVPKMPRTLPAITFGDERRHMHEHNGVVWVPVHAASPPVTQQYWDLIDLARGARLATLAFPPDQYLLKVTALGAYVVAVDDDELQRVLLYRRPAPVLSPKILPSTAGSHR